MKELFLESFDYPVIARPIERGGRRYERLLGSSAELGRYLEDVGGYVFVEPHSNSELYALDLLYNGSDFHILCGSHFHQVENEQPNPRARSFIRRPPFCDRIINEIATLKPSIGRYYVEYHVTGDAVMIREINNGYYDGDSELAVAALLTGDLFRAQLQLCLGQPREPLAQQFVGEFEWLTVADDKEPFDQLLTHNYRAIFRPGRNGEPGWLSVCGPDQQQAQALFYELRNRITQPEDRAASPRHSEVMA